MQASCSEWRDRKAKAHLRTDTRSANTKPSASTNKEANTNTTTNTTHTHNARASTGDI